MQTAFVPFSPLTLSCGCSNSSFVSKRRPLDAPASTTTPTRRIRFTTERTCKLSSQDEDRMESHNSHVSTNNSSEESSTTTTVFSTPEMVEVDEQMSEMDRIAESWIGSDIGRWEWYERLRNRRSKMLLKMEKKSAEMDEDIEQLRRSLLEIDALLGTRMLDQNHDITIMGWAFLFSLTTLYVSIGYAIVHGIVFAICSLHQVSSFP